MFTFFNSILLSAFALALIPILIHFFNRKKSRLVPFGSITFLRSLQNQKIKRLKIRQVLLLILRTLSLILLVIAFARPLIRWDGNGNIEAHSPTSAILILDNSESTSYRSDKGRVLDRITSKATEILDYLREGDEATILTTSGAKRMGFTGRWAELKAFAKEAVTETEMSFEWNSIFEEVDNVLKTARHVNREIYFLSDFQASNFKETRVKHDFPVASVFGINCADDNVTNIGIRDVEVLTKIIEKDKPVDIQFTIKNYSKFSTGDVSLNVYLEGKRVAQNSLTIRPLDEVHLTTVISPKQNGFLNGFAEIDDDALLPDNRRYFTLDVPQEINVLLLGSSRDSEFLKLALKPDPASTAIKIRETSTLYSPDAAASDVIILTEGFSWETEKASILESFVKRGGGLMIFLGGRTPTTEFNSHKKFNTGQISKLAIGATSGSAIEWFKIDRSHPILAAIFDNQKKIVSPLFNTYYQMTPFTGKSIIGFGSNEDFLRESTLGSGKILLFTSSLDPEWNDFALRGVFAPMIHRSVYYLSLKDKAANSYFTTGDPIRLNVPNLPSLRIKNVNSDFEIIPTVKKRGDRSEISSAGILQSGGYNVHQNGRAIQSLVVNVPPSESDLSPIDVSVAVSNAQYVKAAEPLEKVILQSRNGSEVWKWFLAIALVLLICELLIAQSGNGNFKWPHYKSR